MKRYCFLLLFIPLLSLCSCGTGRVHNTWKVSEGITAKLSQAKYPLDVQKMTVILENNSDNSVLYGYSYSLEKLSGGQWIPLEYIDNFGFTMVLYTLQASSTDTIIISTGIFKEKLDIGLYRIKGSNLYVKHDDGEEHSLPAYILEFKIDANATNEPESSSES